MIIVKEDFEHGFTEFDQFKIDSVRGSYRVPKAEIVTTPPNVQGFNSNHVLKIPFDIAEPAPRSERLGPADCNRFIQWNMYQHNLTEFSVSARICLEDTPESVQTTQRKLFYLWGWPSKAVNPETNVSGRTWTIVLSARGGVSIDKKTGQLANIGLDLSTGPYSKLAGGAGSSHYNGNAIQYNKAFDIEMRVKLNSLAAPSSSQEYNDTHLWTPNKDGYIDVLLNGVSVIRRDNLFFRWGNHPLGHTRFGCQTNDGSTTPDGRGWRHEVRYLDNIVIEDLTK